MRKKLIEINKASACVLYLETGKTVTPVSFVPNEDLASGRAMSVLAPWSGTNTPAYIALSIAKTLHALGRIPDGVKCVLCIDTSHENPSAQKKSCGKILTTYYILITPLFLQEFREMSFR